MSDPPLWARTDEQIERLQAAKTYGDRCAACGRALDSGETVYWERFAVGEKRPSRSGGARFSSLADGPVGTECASPELLERTADQEPERCGACGRGVFLRRPQPSRQFASCSRRCLSRQVKARRPPRPKAAAPDHDPSRTAIDLNTIATDTDDWGARARRYREARGLTPADVAAALATALGRRTRGEDVRRWEAGHATPWVETFGALAQVLGVPMEILLYGEEEAARIAEERATLSAGPG